MGDLINVFDGSLGTLHEHLDLLISAVLTVLLVSWIAWRWGFYRLPSDSVSSQTSASVIPLSSVVGAFCTFLVIMLVFVPFLSVLWLSWLREQPIKDVTTHLDIPTQGWLNVFGIIFGTVGMILYNFMIPNEVRHAVWGKNAFVSMRRDVKNIVMGIVTWFVCYPFVIVVSQLMAIVVIWFNIPQLREEQVAVKYIRMAQDYPTLLWTMLFLVVFVVPWLEEFLFRGFLQSYLKQKVGLIAAIALASMIFALFHYSATQGFGNVELLLALFVLSGFLGFLYERQQSLWAPYALHATFNAVSVLVILGS